MMEREVITYLKHVLFVISMTMPRIIAIFSILPFFNKTLQGQIRNSIAFSFALILYPVVSDSIPKEINMLFVILIICKEVIIGMIIGFTVSVIFWAIEGIGFVIDNQRGSTMAVVFDPFFGEQTSIFGSLLLQFMTVLFFVSGGFLVMLSGIFESYQIWPIFSLLPRLDTSFCLFFLNQVDNLMKLIVLFAAPILIAIFISEFGLGLINRFAPQLNVFFLSMPIKSGIACFLMILYLSFLYTFLKDQLLTLNQTILFLRTIISYE